LSDTPAVIRSADAGFSFGTVWHDSFATPREASIADTESRTGYQIVTTPRLTANRASAIVTQGARLSDLIAQNGLTGNPPFDGRICKETPRTGMASRASSSSARERRIESLRRYWMREVNGNLSLSHKAAYATASKDQSVPNLSSLVFMLEDDGRRILFTGDARGDQIAEKLAELDLLTDDTLEVDALKVPRHSSERSCTSEPFETVRTDH
jgi:hypothetical protein